MSWLRNHKNTVYRAGIGIAAVSLIGFLWEGAGPAMRRGPVQAEKSHRGRNRGQELHRRIRRTAERYIPVQRGHR